MVKRSTSSDHFSMSVKNYILRI